MGLISYKKFQALVDHYSGDYKVKVFSCWKQFLCMSFGQLTHRESISGTMMCLKANAGKMYHLGIGQTIAVSTITRANESRSFQIYEDLAMLLIKEARQLYMGEDDLEVDLKGNVFAIDATTIDLCLSTFYWATFRTTKAGIKLHTQLDLKTSNRTKSKFRARVEHVFGFMEISMKRMYIHSIGKVRAEGIIGLMNLTYNLLRSIQIKTLGRIRVSI